MHPSYFLVLNTQEDDTKREFELLAEVSEWLFSRRFWEEFNQKHEVLFAQYEEEVLPKSLLTEMLEKVRSLVTDLSQQPELKTRFRYGWNENKEELICVVGNNEIIGELSKLILFIEEASALKSDVYCQL